jgi:8-oxo-dGTP pyrophosphatase MutT (NUDIX family)
MGISTAIDFDGSDTNAIHVVAFRGPEPIATGRLRPDQARLGRMAVRREERGRGLGAELLRQLLRETVRAGIPLVKLHAQERAIGFYRRFGFKEEGRRFEEAGIAHQRMFRPVTWRSAVAGLLVSGGKVLLGLRAPHLTMGDHWDLFGGKIEPDEDDIQALVREIREELSLGIEPAEPLDVIIYEDGRDQSLWRCPVYVVRDWEGAVEINEEHLEARWFAPDELAHLRLAHGRIRELAKRALQETE